MSSKLESDVCCRHLVRATKVNAGLAESNGRLLLGIWHDSLHVTCGLTACTPGSAPGPTLGNEHGKTLPLPLLTDELRCCVRADQLNTGSHLMTAGEDVQVMWFQVEHELSTTISDGLVPTYSIDSAGQHQTWNWVIGSPGQWVIWVIFHVRVTGSS